MNHAIGEEKITVVHRCNQRKKNEITLKEALGYIEKSEDLKVKIAGVRSKQTEPERRKEKTAKLQAFAFAGLFNNDVKKEAFSSPSGLFCIDIDHIGNVQASKLIIAKIPCVVSCFVSPSGDGLKAIIRINKAKITSDNEVKKLFPSIRALFLEHGFILDESRKDISGLCFASYDPDLYINYAADIFDPVIVEAKKEAPESSNGFEYKSNDNDAKFCLNTVIKMFIAEGQNGHRHEIRLKACRLAGGYIAAGRVDEGEIRAAIQRASDVISDKGITSKEEQKTIDDGIEYGKKSPVYSKEPIKPAIAIEVQEESKADISVWLNADEMAEQATAPTYLINNIIETRTHGLIAGSSQSFKSFCVLKMAHSICTGQDFFGHSVFDKGKVLYICGEGLGALGRRIRALKIVKGDFNGNFFVLNKPLFIDNIAEMDWLNKQILALNPLLVIYDTFSSLATSTKENVNEEVARCLRMVSDCCHGTGTSSIVVHHYGKDADKGSRGASAFGANVDFEIGMSRGTGLNAVMSCKKSKDGDFFEDIEILAHVVELGLTRQDGGITSSLVLKRANSDGILTPRQEIVLNTIKELIYSNGIFLNGVTGVTKDIIKKEINRIFESEGNNRYAIFDKTVPNMIKKGVIFERDGVFFL